MNPQSTETTETFSSPALKTPRLRGYGLRPRSLLLVCVAGIVGFLAVSQLAGPDRFRQQLRNESEGDLTRILASLSSESSALQQELGSLKLDLANLQNSATAQGAAAQEIDKKIKSLQVLSATTPVNGPGLQLIIKDPQNQLTFDVLVDVIQELRDAGAEALAINSRRIGTASSFGQDGTSVTLDGSTIGGPYVIEAIGPASTMEGGVKIPGGAVDTLHALNGVSVDVKRLNNLEIPALSQPPTFRAARPIGSSK